MARERERERKEIVWEDKRETKIQSKILNKKRSRSKHVEEKL